MQPLCDSSRQTLSPASYSNGEEGRANQAKLDWLIKWGLRGETENKNHMRGHLAQVRLYIFFPHPTSCPS